MYEESGDSIFSSVKKLLIGNSEDMEFDMDIRIHINSALGVLTQLGVGPKEGFFITGPSETWTDFAGNDKRLEMIKTFVYLKTKLIFDPPTSSILMQALEKQAAEYEWRICNRDTQTEGGT